MSARQAISVHGRRLTESVVVAPPSDPRKPLYLALRLYGAVLAAAVEILLLFFAGVWLDRRLETSPWLTVVGAVMGFTLGTYHLYTAVRAAIRDQ